MTREEPRIWSQIDRVIPHELLTSDWTSRQRARLSVVIPLAFAVAALLAAVAQIYYDRPPIGIAISSAGIVVCLLATQLIRLTRSVTVTGNILLAVMVLMMGANTIIAGGLGTARLFALMLVPMVGALVAGWRAALFWAGLLGVGVASLLVLHELGLGPAPDQSLNELRRAHGIAALIMLVVALAITVTYDRAHARASAELEDARDRADGASQLKSRLVANVSHELRTPLNGIVGSADLLARSDLDDAQREHLDVILHSSDSLLRLVNDLLDLSRIEAGGLEVEHAAFELHQILEQSVNALRVAAGERGIALRLAIADRVPETVGGDALRLRQVLTNLVNNAIKFTEEGEVSVHVEVSGPGVRFEIRDTGIGIEEAAIARLFESFEQADISTARRYGGSGLGLAIASHLVELMGGAIDVESTVGVGSVFRFDLPLTSTPRTTTEAPDVRASWSDGGRVLVADDNETNLAVIERQLRHLGFEPTLVSDGQSALEAARHGRWFAIFLDIQMPGMDGYETARALREWERSSGSAQNTLFALTAHESKEQRNLAVDAGFDRFFVKPMKISSMKATLDELVAPSVDDRVWTTLVELAAGEARFLEKLVSRFLESADQRLEALSSADPQQVEEICHSLKGSARQIGALKLGELVAEIESQPELRDERLSSLRTEVGRTRTALNRRISCS